MTEETPMSEADTAGATRAEHFIESLGRIEGLVAQLGEAMATAVEDIEALNKAGYREGGHRGLDTVLGAGASVDSLWGKVRGRCRAHGLERLLQRTTPAATDDNWVDDIATRLRAVV